MNMHTKKFKNICLPCISKKKITAEPEAAEKDALQ